MLETIFIYGVKEGKKRFLFNLFSTERKLEREKNILFELQRFIFVFSWLDLVVEFCHLCNGFETSTMVGLEPSGAMDDGGWGVLVKQ